MQLHNEPVTPAVMSSYLCNLNFALFVHVLVFSVVMFNPVHVFSLHLFILNQIHLESRLNIVANRKRLLPNMSWMRNKSFVSNTLKLFAIILLFTWLLCLLLEAGDIHPNPGPSTSSSPLSSSSTTSSISSSFNNSFNAILNSFHHLSFVQYNVQSIYNKLDILSAELLEFDIMAFTETWLHPGIPNEDLRVATYQTPERKDRNENPHGGVLIYIKDNIHYIRRHDLEIPGTECIWVEIVMNHKRLLFGLFYRPPDATNLTLIEDSIHLAIDTGMTDIVITGDFNYNMLSEPTRRKIIAICQQFSLSQHITEPTHYTENSASLIDIIMTTNSTNLHLTGVGDPFLSQNIRFHCPIFGILNFSKPKVKTFERQIWLYNQGNYDQMREKASSTDWDSFQNADIDVYAENITNRINELSNECIPNKNVKIKPSNLPWLTTTIKRLIRKRKRLFRKAKQTSNPASWQKFRRLRNKITSMIRLSKQNHINTLADKLKSETLSSRDWWPTLKHFISTSQTSTLPPLQCNDELVTDDTEKANLLNDYFRDQTLLDDSNVEVPFIQDYPVTSYLNDINLNSDEIRQVLKSLPIGKASGPDGISNRVLKELADELAAPLCSVFNQSIHDGCVPKIWKLAHVSPIPKKEDRSLVSNHRPISLLSNVDKVFERVMFKYLYNHLVENNILTAFQSGFVPGDSTTNQLTFLYDAFCRALDEEKEIRVVFCDISKAFDRVWHKGLVRKLEAAGITGTTLRWFTNYLKDRKQRVVIPGAKSNWNYIQAGVPQGSILGPILFLIYINDIVSDIQANIRLFADDTSLYVIVENPDSAALCLNTDLNKIFNWGKVWLVKFNYSKNESMILTRKVIKPYHPPIYMENTEIEEVNAHKHLGIIFSNDCTWHSHIDYIKEKAWKRISIMRKLKFVLDWKSLETIYISFIRPIIEYGDTIWDNCAEYEKRELDKIQNEAARIVSGATALVSLESLYNDVCWESLQERRTKHKLNLFFKMQHDLVPGYLSALVPPSVSEISRYNLRNANDFTTIRCSSQQYYSTFIPSVVREWNNLPEEAKQIGSLISFKFYLNRDKKKVPKYYGIGKRKLQILHTRLRTKCSSLNNDLFLKNMTESALCACGAIENAHHYFFTCGRYDIQRREMFDCLSEIPNLNLKKLLFGDETMSYQINVKIFLEVQKYIEKTRRF